MHYYISQQAAAEGQKPKGIIYLEGATVEDDIYMNITSSSSMSTSPPNPNSNNNMNTNNNANNGSNGFTSSSGSTSNGSNTSSNSNGIARRSFWIRTNYQG